jgi:acetyl esterase/lipase
MISEVKPEDVVFMGDSAGGGISLALAQLLKEKNLSQPGNIILISPALDLSFTNPDARKFKAMADEQGININYYEYPSMLHVWSLFSFPESKKATGQMIQIIKGTKV